MQPQVIVRGAGIFGLSCAWAMVQRGARVCVVDPNGPGAGASGGIVGALAPHVPENWNPKKAFQLHSLLMAPAFWAGVETAGGVRAGYVPSGRLQPIADTAAVARARARGQTAATLWQGRATWRIVSAVDLAGISPGWLPHSPTGLYIHDTLSALVHPRRAVAALVAALAAQGAEIVREMAPSDVPVLWATGVQGLRDLGVARPSVKGQAVLLDHAALDHAARGHAVRDHAVRGQPQVFADGLHIIPHADGTTAIGSTSEPDVFDTDTDAQTEGLLDRARAVLPALAKARVFERWAGLRPRAPSRAPLLGPWPDRPGHFIANGGFKIGFGMAPRVGEVMADLILNGVDRVPAGFRTAANAG